MEFTIKIELDQPHESAEPTREEFARMLSGIAYTSMLQAIGTGLPRPAELEDGDALPAFARAMLPHFEVGGVKAEHHEDGGATVHV